MTLSFTPARPSHRESSCRSRPRRVFTALVSVTGDQWLVRVPELPGLVTYVASSSEAERETRNEISLALTLDPHEFDIETIVEETTGP